MGKRIVLFILFSLLISGLSLAQKQVLNSEPIDIDGYVKDEQVVMDDELKEIHEELKTQVKSIKINKKKAKAYQKLTQTTEKLAETTEEYINNRQESQEAIEKYQKMMECRDSHNPDCKKL